MNQDEAYFNEQEQRLHELHMNTLKLKQLRDQLECIRKEIKDVTEYITGELNFDKEGQIAYDICGVSLQVTKPISYTVNNERYIILKDSIEPEINPVKENISYEVDEGKLHNILNFCSNEDKEFLDDIISKNYGSISIRVKQ